MASQVLSGATNASYTNNTGQNVRLIINYMANVTSMSWAGVNVTGDSTTIGKDIQNITGEFRQIDNSDIVGYIYKTEIRTVIPTRTPARPDISSSYQVTFSPNLNPNIQAVEAYKVSRAKPTKSAPFLWNSIIGTPSNTSTNNIFQDANNDSSSPLNLMTSFNSSSSTFVAGSDLKAISNPGKSTIESVGSDDPSDLFIDRLSRGAFTADSNTGNGIPNIFYVPLTVSRGGNFPVELMLAPNQQFSAVCGAFNAIVIKEDGT